MSSKTEPYITTTNIRIEEYPVVSFLVRIPCSIDSRPFEIDVRVPSPSESTENNIDQAKQLLQMALEMLIKELKES